MHSDIPNFALKKVVNVVLPTPMSFIVSSLYVPQMKKITAGIDLIPNSITLNLV